MRYTAQEVADFLHGVVDGDPNVELHDFGGIENGKAGTLTFLANPAYEHYLYTTECSAVLVQADYQPTSEVKTTLIRVADPYDSLAKLLSVIRDGSEPEAGISQFAIVDPSADVDPTASVGPFVYIGKNSKVGPSTIVRAQVYIGEDCLVGADCKIYQQVTISNRTIVGDRCILHSGAVLGADGFGFAPTAEGWDKIPQTGKVILEDDVEIGANACIDRAVLDATIIRRGVKIDNLVQIAHNCEVKEHTAIAAQSGVAGSTTIGQWNRLGGQVGIAGHLKTADRVTFGAKTGIMASIEEEGSSWFGYPGRPYVKAMRSAAVADRLPQLDKQIYDLSKEVKRLREELDKLSEISKTKGGE